MTRLFELLPAVHRVRDAAQAQLDAPSVPAAPGAASATVRGPLETLLDAIDAELALVGGDIDQLYDDWFIETCEDWVVPYLGDLVGVGGLGGTAAGTRTQRALVANTLRYRRRKGTAAVLEQLAADVTGWTAKAVEGFALLGWNQHPDHVRAGRGGTADLRDADRASLADGPFDPFAHTADVRHADTGTGRHNLMDVALFLWRLQAYPLARSTAAGGAGRFTFDPLGRDVPLFNRPAAERAIEHLAEERNVEGPLRRRPLHDELAAGIPSPDQDDGVDRYLSPADPVLAVWLDGAPLRPDQLSICDLGDAARMATAPAVAAVDPVLGRVALRPGDARTPEVSWAYGFGGDVGGGPYDRRASVRAALASAQAAAADAPWWQLGVVRDAAGPDLVPDLAAAIAAWSAGPRKPLALVAVMDSRTYRDPIDIVVPGGSTLVIAAGDWDPRPDPTGGPEHRRPGDIAATRQRPTIVADVTIRGTPGPAGAAPGVVVLDGFLVEGTVTVAAGTLGGLRIAHSTLVPRPGRPSLVVAAGGAASTRNLRLAVELDHAICGGIAATEFIAGFTARDSIVQGDVDVPDAVIERCTLLGGVRARTIHASDAIFAEPLLVTRRQAGCVRYSYLEPGSVTPRRYRCVPDEAFPGVRPTFTSTTLGDPGYGQLGRTTPDAIRRGGDAEGEMGAFAFLDQPRRLADLESRLDEYLRLGLEAGVFFVT